MTRRGPRSGQSLVELALILPFLVGLASLVLQAGSLVQARLRFDAANAAVLRVAYTNERAAPALETIFAAELGAPAERLTFAVTTTPKDPVLDDLPAVWIETSYRVPGVGLLALTDGPVTLRARLGSPLKIAGSPGVLLSADDL